MVPGGAPDGEYKLAKAQRENTGGGASRDPREGGCRDQQSARARQFC